MTTVYVHGLLGKEFGRKFKFSLSRASDALKAIDANKKGFCNRIIELSKKGAHYSLVVDGKLEHSPLSIKNIKEVHVVPAIAGSAGTAAAIGAIAMIVGYSAPAWLPAWLAPVLIAVGSAALSYGLSNLLMKDSGLTAKDAGSASARANALNKSFLFSNGENVAEQGNPVPLGYGRLRIGSAVIQSTIKSFPAKFDEKNGLPIFNEFTQTATKKGGSYMAYVDNQDEIQTNN